MNEGMKIRSEQHATDDDADDDADDDDAADDAADDERNDHSTASMHILM